MTTLMMEDLELKEVTRAKVNREKLAARFINIADKELIALACKGSYKHRKELRTAISLVRCYSNRTLH